MLGDGLPEGSPDLSVANRVLEGGPHDAHGARGDVDPPRLQTAHRHAEPRAFPSAHQIDGRHGEILEDQLAGFYSLVAQLREIAAHGEAGLPLLDDERGDPVVRRLGIRIGFCQQQERVPVAAVGDPHLHAVHEVTVAVAGRGGAQGRHVASRIGLGERKAAALLPGGHPWEPAPLLLLRAESPQHPGHDEVRVEHAREAHPPAADLLDDERVGHRVEPHPPVLLRDGGAKQAHFLHAIDQRVGVRVGVLVGGGGGHHLLPHELPHGVDQRELLVGEGEIHETRSTNRAGSVRGHSRGRGEAEGIGRGARVRGERALRLA